MKQWELWKFPYPSAEKPHWFVILSPSAWCENPNVVAVNGLLCTTLRPPGRDIKPHELRLDAADGLDWDSVVRCSYMHELPKVKATEQRGPVARLRRAEIVRRLNQLVFTV